MSSPLISQADEAVPLCPLATGVAAGTHARAVVLAIFVSGAEASFLYDPRCEQGAPLTWVEFGPHVRNNKRKLERILKKSGRAIVELEGEIWGPRVPDRRLPEGIRQIAPTGWGHLSAYRTRFVVRAIKHVEPVQKHVPYYQWPRSEDRH